MAKTSREKRYTPLIILLLVAPWWRRWGFGRRDRAGQKQADYHAGDRVRQREHYHWKMITTWPKNFPGLGFAAENFSPQLWTNE